MLGRGGAVELRGLAAKCISGQTNYLEGLLRMGFSGKTAIVTERSFRQLNLFKTTGGGVRIVVAGTRFEAFG